MNIFRQDSQTVLFILKSFGRPLPLLSTIFSGHPADQSRVSHFASSILRGLIVQGRIGTYNFVVPGLSQLLF